MRTYEAIAAEATRITFGHITKRTLIIALEMCYGEALAEMWPLQNKQPLKQYAYILTGSTWNDILHYIRAIELQGVTVTNTAFNNFPDEISRADYVIALRGWNETKQGRERGAYIKTLGKKIKQYKTFLA